MLPPQLGEEGRRSVVKVKQGSATGFLAMDLASSRWIEARRRDSHWTEAGGEEDSVERSSVRTTLGEARRTWEEGELEGEGAVEELGPLEVGSRRRRGRGTRLSSARGRRLVELGGCGESPRERQVVTSELGGGVGRDGGSELVGAEDGGDWRSEAVEGGVVGGRGRVEKGKKKGGAGGVEIIFLRWEDFSLGGMIIIIFSF